MRTFDSLSEQEILALAISLEEEDARIYDDISEEYEKLPAGPPQQLIEGEIIMTPSPTPMH